MTAGWSLRLAPLCLVVSALLRPDWTDDERVLLARVDAEGGEHLAAILLGLAGAALAVPAVLGLMHMLRERHTTGGHVAGIISLAGVAGLGFHYAIELVVWQVAQGGRDRGSAVLIVDRLTDEPVIAAGFDYLPIALAVGLTCLGIVLRAADAVEPWSAHFLLVGPGLAAAGLFVPDPTMLKIGWAIVLASTNKIGKRVLAQDAYDWSHWPAWTFEWSWKR